MMFWKGRKRNDPNAAYEEEFNRTFELIDDAARDGAITADSQPILEVVAHGGCHLASHIVTNFEELKRAWRRASDGQRTALAEVCTLELLVYVMSVEGTTMSVDVIEEYVSVLDAIFDRAFANPVDFAASLYVQIRHDKDSNRKRIEDGESGRSIWAAAMALNGAAFALGVGDSPMRPLPDRFPIADSQSLKEAGVPLTYWDGQISQTVAYFSLLLDYTKAAVEWYSKIRQLAPDERARARDEGAWLRF